VTLPAGMWRRQHGVRSGAPGAHAGSPLAPVCSMRPQTIPLGDADFGKEMKLKVTKFNNVNSIHLFLDREGAACARLRQELKQVESAVVAPPARPTTPSSRPSSSQAATTARCRASSLWARRSPARI
jgi:hypothetical protein